MEPLHTLCEVRKQHLCSPYSEQLHRGAGNFLVFILGNRCGLLTGSAGVLVLGIAHYKQLSEDEEGLKKAPLDHTATCSLNRRFYLLNPCFYGLFTDELLASY